MGTSHVERTAAEPRDDVYTKSYILVAPKLNAKQSFHNVILSHGEEVMPTIRLLRLSIAENQEIKFLAGQWLDVQLPGIPRPGGFTITSSPSKARINKTHSPYLELAVQSSPNNPAAAYLWQPFQSILGTALDVRVGGSFVWPPSNISLSQINRVVFIAGGVGINPLMSIVSYLAEQETVPLVIRFMYSFRYPEAGCGAKILFEERLRGIFDRENVKGKLAIHRTSGGLRAENGKYESESEKILVRDKRIEEEDVLEALGPVEERDGVVCYICGIPTMTDWFVEIASRADGMTRSRVLFERWW